MTPLPVSPFSLWNALIFSLFYHFLVYFVPFPVTDTLADLPPSLLAPRPKPPSDDVFHWANPETPFDPLLTQQPESPPSVVPLSTALPVDPDTPSDAVLLPIYDIDGRISYQPTPPKPRPVTPLPFSNYPLPSPSKNSPTPDSPSSPCYPSLNESLSVAAQNKFALTLDQYDPRIRAKLDQPFGKDNLTQCFRAEPRLRHVLLPLWKSGFLYQDDVAWTSLATACTYSRTFLVLLREYGDVDFNSLRGYPVDWESESAINENRVRMTTAALMHFNGSAADMVRWVGGPHVAAHRDHKSILRRLQLAGVPRNVYFDIKRIFLHGIPQSVNADATEANFQAFFTYGNHATVDEDPAKTYKALVKDNKKGYTLLFDPRFIPFLLHCHLTPQGVVDLNTINKNPRPIFDSSFRPFPWCSSINDWTHKRNEPPLTFAHAEEAFMIWIYNLRISYPYSEIYLADDDVSGAFRHGKYGPNVVAMHTSQQCGYGVLNTGATFGDNTSPSNFDPLALGRRYLAQYLWINDDSVVDRTISVLPPLQLEASPPDDVTATFTQADRDSLNLGVFDHHGNRRPPPYPMHVDDNLYGDIAPYLERTVAASAAALFDLLGWPDSRVPLPLSLDKLESFYNHQRRMVGRHFDSRKLTVGMLPYKRDALLALLVSWTHMTSFTLQEVAQLLGTLDNHTKYARWARCWYFTIQNVVRQCLNQRYYALSRLHNRFQRIESNLCNSLPTPLRHRLATLVAREKASFLWHNRSTFTIPPPMLTCLRILLEYIQSTPNPWEVPIGMIIPREAHFVSTGDASFVGCGGSCPQLQFWFDLPWTTSTMEAVRKRPSAPGFIHINDLEFITLILMLAAINERLASLPVAVEATCFPNGIPNIPVWLGYTDNLVSRAWEVKATATSRRGQALIGVYSALLQTSNIHTMSHHIKGVDNVVADDISRNDFSLPPSLRLPQLFAKHPSLASFDYFQPSQPLLQLLTSKLFSEPEPQLCVLPKPLGHFVPAGCTTFISLSL